MTPDPRLVALADRLVAHIGYGNGPVKRDERLERDILWHVNSLMEGDGGLCILHSHRAALHFIAQLLRHNCFVGENVREAETPETNREQIK